MNNPYFHSKLAETNLSTRERIFNGDVFLIPPGPAASALIQKVLALMESALETEDIRHAHLKWSAKELFERLGAMRRTVYLEKEYHDAIRDIAQECGFAGKRVAFDPIRLRVVLPGGHNNPLAAPVYYPHRDTWYAHPQSLIVWWIPLHDLIPEETFVFYPNLFDRPVGNDSEIFDYSDWIKDGPALKIGWQKYDSGLTASYPKAASNSLPDRAEGFACKAGENLLFAGAHFHRTLPQDFGRIRFSLDFRVVDMEDVACGRGAPNADNRSRGSTLKDYVQPLE